MADIKLAFKNARSAQDKLDELIKDPRLELKENEPLRKKLEAVRKAVLVVMNNT